MAKSSWCGRFHGRVFFGSRPRPNSKSLALRFRTSFLVSYFFIFFRAAFSGFNTGYWNQSKTKKTNQNPSKKWNIFQRWRADWIKRQKQKKRIKIRPKNRIFSKDGAPIESNVKTKTKQIEIRPKNGIFFKDGAPIESNVKNKKNELKFVQKIEYFPKMARRLNQTSKPRQNKSKFVQKMEYFPKMAPQSIKRQNQDKTNQNSSRNGIFSKDGAPIESNITI